MKIGLIDVDGHNFPNLALISSQEQRIGAQDMTISDLRKRAEKAEHDADRYAQRIKELTKENERLRAENANLDASCTELTRKMQDNVRVENEELRKSSECDVRKLKADTVRQFAERLKKFYQHYDGKSYGYTIAYHIDQVAKEMFERISNAETCVTCGDPIPEGRQVCPKCEEDKL